MTRKRKPSGRLSGGPWTYSDLQREFLRVGYEPLPRSGQSGGSHENWRHPDRSGTAQLDTNWDRVKVGSIPWQGLVAQTGYSSKELRRIMNGL
jgi:hypothetical protein